MPAAPIAVTSVTHASSCGDPWAPPLTPRAGTSRRVISTDARWLPRPEAHPIRMIPTPGLRLGRKPCSVRATAAGIHPPCRVTSRPACRLPHGGGDVARAWPKPARRAPRTHWRCRRSGARVRCRCSAPTRAPESSAVDPCGRASRPLPRWWSASRTLSVPIAGSRDCLAHAPASRDCSGPAGAVLRMRSVRATAEPTT